MYSLFDIIFKVFKYNTYWQFSRPAVLLYNILEMIFTNIMVVFFAGAFKVCLN